MILVWFVAFRRCKLVQTACILSRLREGSEDTRRETKSKENEEENERQRGGSNGGWRRRRRRKLTWTLVHFELGIRELVMNNASALRASGRPTGDRIRAGQTEVPGERTGPPALNAKWRWQRPQLGSALFRLPRAASSSSSRCPSRMTISRSNDFGNGISRRGVTATIENIRRCLSIDE